MRVMAADQIKNYSRELGLTWRKLLVLAVLGVALGFVFAIAIPLQVS